MLENIHILTFAGDNTSPVTLCDSSRPADFLDLFAFLAFLFTQLTCWFITRPGLGKGQFFFSSIFPEERDTKLTLKGKSVKSSDEYAASISLKL